MQASFTPSAQAAAGILLIAHAPLASATMEVVRHVLGGSPEGAVAVDVPPIEEHEAWVRRCTALIEANAWSEVLLLSDLPGGTPCNVAVKTAAELATRGKTGTVVCGVTPGMLLVALDHLNALPLRRLAQCVLIESRRSVVSWPLQPASERQACVR